MGADGAVIARGHQGDGVTSTALYSPCGGYRYLLTRTWAPDLPTLLAVLLNPSTATEAQGDPTADRCLRRARAAGYGSLTIANLFALRATDPRALRRSADPVGPENDLALSQAAGTADRILCAWGNHGALQDRGLQVRAQLWASGRPLCHLGLTRHGQPVHPLYIAADRPMQDWA
jgi:hypothetical protein